MTTTVELKGVGAGDNLLKKYKVPQDSTSSNSNTEFEDEGVRHTWGKKAEYLLASIGYCVGLGNIWRFPYVCMRNGGGAFLIPFFLSLIVCALPIFFLETAIGQFNGQSSWHVWSICPLFKGIGISMNLMTFYLTWYYSIILAWALIYMANSFKSPLPWSTCDGSWNTERCVDLEGNPAASVLQALTASSNFSSLSNANVTDSYDINTTLLTSLLSANGSMEAVNSTILKNDTISSADEFWLHNVLERSSGLTDMGGLPWHTVVALVVANILVLFGVIKGIRSTGKVVYVTATLPYLLLTVIIILGITLPGSADGVIFYLRPDFSKLLSFQTWVDAFIQVFYSLGPGWGGLITMGSYNKFKNNCMRDSILLTLCCEGSSVFGGFAIFTVLGHMAYAAKVPIEEFAKSGVGLAFIVYPTAIAYLPMPQLWGVLFFLMLFTLGLDTQFTNVETLLTTVADLWPRFVSKWRKSFSCLTMLFFTLTALVFCSRGGIFVFALVDWYVGMVSLMSQSILECLIIGFIYGTDRFGRDIEMMIGRRPPYIFILSWKYITPITLTVAYGITLATYAPPSYGDYTYSSSLEIIGWIYSSIPFSFVIIMAVREIFKHKGTLRERFRKATQPTAQWAPNDPELRLKYRYDMDDDTFETSRCDNLCNNRQLKV